MQTVLQYSRGHLEKPDGSNKSVKRALSFLYFCSWEAPETAKEIEGV